MTIAGRIIPVVLIMILAVFLTAGAYFFIVKPSLKGAQCTPGEVRPCGSNVGMCKMGNQTCDDGVWGSCDAARPSTDICDGKDNDCDGQTDEGCSSGEKIYPFGFAGPWPPDDYNKIVEVGADYVRTDITWNLVETSDNTFDFSSADAGYDKLKDTYGLGLILRLKMRDSWATNCDTTSIKCPIYFDTCPKSSADCPPKDLGEWNDEYGYSKLLYDFIYKLLKHMHDTNRPLEYIIVGNEANTLTFWHGTSDDYFKTRGTVYKAVHDANLDFGESTSVLDNGFAGGVWGFALMRDEACSGNASRIAYAKEFAKRYFRRKYTQAQINNYTVNLDYFCANPDRSQLILRDVFKKDPNMEGPSFDIMAYHFNEPWDTQEEIINWIRAEMQKNGYQKPIMHTEGGYYDRLRLLNDSSANDQVRRDVADDIPKLHVIAFANGVTTWLWLPFTERYTSEYYGPELSGLISPSPALTELPAFTSYKVMTTKLSGFTDVQKITVGAHSYKFTVNGKPVYVLWSTTNATINFSSEIPGSVKVTKVDGTTQVLSSSSLQITESPIFVENV